MKRTYNVVGRCTISYDCDCPDCPEGNTHYEDHDINVVVEADDEDDAISEAERDAEKVTCISSEFWGWLEDPTVKVLEQDVQVQKY